MAITIALHHRTVYQYDAARPVEAKLTLLRREGGAAIDDLAYPSPIVGTVNGFLVVPERDGRTPRRSTTRTWR